MATFAIGKIGNFDDGVETLGDYAEHLQKYYLANEVANDKKVPALLSLIGPKTYLCVAYAMKTSRKTSYPKTILLWIKLLKLQ